MSVKPKIMDHPAFKTRAEFLDTDERVALAYSRAKALLEAWNLSLDDISHCSPKFWAMQNDPAVVLDIGCNNVLACHINLFIGTLAPHAVKRPEIATLLQKALRFEVVGNLLLSEIGHGLDILNLETTATWNGDGFVLHTPNPRAAKFMPPTTPISTVSKYAIVMAHLVIGGRSYGIHPFLVRTSEGSKMAKGVSSKRLPPRSGSSPLDFALTIFDNVSLPKSAFLGDPKFLSGCPTVPTAEQIQKRLHAYIWRIGIGSMAIAVPTVNAMKMVAYIGGTYSQLRHVRGKGSVELPIIAFRTQQLPVLYAVALSRVFDAWLPKAIETFMDQRLPTQVRHAMAVVFKATTCRLLTWSCREVGERLGAQGTFGHNLVSQMEMDCRGISIAEGDILVLCIRLWSELLLERYHLVPYPDSATLLARRSADYFKSGRTLLHSFEKGHRDPRFNALVLPVSERAICAYGHALAHGYARRAGVAQPLLDLFELAVIKLDPTWYIECAGITGESLMDSEDRAVQATLPALDKYIRELDVSSYVTAPIVDASRWSDWENQLREHRTEDGGGQDVYHIKGANSFVLSKL
ncbi:hypothetical protein OE88DRAFT_1812070 [Heliocybe sulcata]|uniref:Acyl-CoA dehydrogenase NM domain-like protein n=1 Tax=Heliocybe sulcata TaxID=5364 RepID=A0A5C3MN82_9AGAM|nr:hypothetical protein OE88DRAFT_1812070 [Heliocybe sulcata]